MFERFTDRGRKIIILAREEAERHQNDYLGTEHLVLAIIRESDGIALMIIKKMGLSPEQIRLEIERNLPSGGTTVTFGEIPFSPRVKKVIEYGVEEARLLGHNHIGWLCFINCSLCISACCCLDLSGISPSHILPFFRQTRISSLNARLA